VPAGSVIAASDPPEATEPEHIIFFREMNALHHELALLLSPSTVPPRTIADKNKPTTVAMNDNRDPTDLITDEYGSTHHSNKNHDSDGRVNVDSATADRKTDARENDKNQHDNHDTDNQENTAHNTNTTDDDDRTQHKSPQTWHRQQYTSTLEHTRQVTHPSHNSCAEPASSTTTTREMATTPMGSACDNSANLNNKQSPQQTRTDGKYNTTLAQL